MPQRQRTSKRKFLGSKQGVLFLVFAAVIWTLSALSENYTTTVPVQFKLQADSNNFVVSAPRIEVPARVTSSGFSVLYRRIFPRKVLLFVSELPIKDIQKPTIETDFLLNKYNEVYGSSSQISRFVPNAILVPITQAIQKTFTPTLSALPQFEEGYQLISPLSFSVDTITAFGSKAILEKLDKAIFELTSEKHIREDFSMVATLVDSIAQSANWDTTSVVVSGNVDRYSDVSMLLPVHLIDAPEDMNVTLSPKSVEIKFAAPLSSLRSIDESAIRANAFFEKTPSGQLSVRITGLPTGAKKQSIEPPTVSYFIIE